MLFQWLGSVKELANKFLFAEGQYRQLYCKSNSILKRVDNVNIKELLEVTGWSMAQMAKYFNIPYRTIQSWMLGDRKANQYILDLMEYKLKNEKII